MLFFILLSFIILYHEKGEFLHSPDIFQFLLYLNKPFIFSKNEIFFGFLFVSTFTSTGSDIESIINIILELPFDSLGILSIVLFSRLKLIRASILFWSVLTSPLTKLLILFMP